MIHRSSICLFGAVIISVILDCAGRSESLKPSLANAQDHSGQLDVADEQAGGKLTVVVNDRLDRKVKFVKAPKRIISLLPSTTELQFAIGAGPQIVGATRHCNNPREAAELVDSKKSANQYLNASSAIVFTQID